MPPLGPRSISWRTSEEPATAVDSWRCASDSKCPLPACIFGTAAAYQRLHVTIPVDVVECPADSSDLTYVQVNRGHGHLDHRIKIYCHIHGIVREKCEVVRADEEEVEFRAAERAMRVRSGGIGMEREDLLIA